MKLSALQVQRAKPGPKPYKLSDGQGLYLFVPTTGSRLWRMNYRFDGRQKTLAIGQFPAVSLADARVERDRAREHLAAGRDPGEQRKADAAKELRARQNTFKAISEEWRAMREQEDLAECTTQRDREILQTYAYPNFGDMPITEVRATDLLDIIRKMEARGSRTLTRKFRRVVSRVFRYAIITERADRDPAAHLAGTLLPETTKHHPAITDPIKVGALMNCIQGYDGLPQVRLALLFIAHTFLRSIEMRRAEWSWIDWENALMFVPAEAMKMRRAHTVPLSPQAIRILKDAQALQYEGVYIFPGARGVSRPMMSENTLTSALLRMGYGGMHVPHGFRTTASTTLHASGLFNSDWIERQLAHADADRIRATYNSAGYLPERIKMMAWYSEWLERQTAVSALV